jgi:hypothetical protein
VGDDPEIGELTGPGVSAARPREQRPTIRGSGPSRCRNQVLMRAFDVDSRAMAYLKCLLVGLVTGIGTAVLWGAARLLIPLLLIRFSHQGGLGSVSIAVPGDLLAPFLAGFALGGFLTRRRQRQRAASTR